MKYKGCYFLVALLACHFDPYINGYWQIYVKADTMPVSCLGNGSIRYHGCFCNSPVVVSFAIRLVVSAISDINRPIAER